MSATTQRISLSHAKELAWELSALLSPACARIEIAGSVRRERSEIGDLELVAVPALIERWEPDLFGSVQTLPPIDLLAEQTDKLLTEGIIGPWYDAHGSARWGKRYRAFTYEGIKVDLFKVVKPAQWGVILALRTGSADFSRRLVTPVEKGGWMPARMFCERGLLWKDGLPLVTLEEETLFEQVGRPYVPAPLREVR